MIKHTKKLMVQSLKVLFSVGLIYWLISSGKLNLAALSNLLSPLPAAAALTLIFINQYIASERWRMLVKSQGLATKSWPMFKLSLIGGFFNFAMPGGVGGDVIKAFYFHKQHQEQHHNGKIIAITSVLMDRVLGLFAMVLMALIVLLWDYEHISKIPSLYTLLVVVAGISIAFCIGLALVFSQSLYKKNTLTLFIRKLPLSSKLIKLYESMHLYGNQGARILLVILFSLISQCCAIVFLYLAGQVTGYPEISLKTYFMVAPLGFMATAIPISPAGVGVGQAAFYFLFNVYTGTQSELGPTAMTAFQVGNLLVSLLGAVFYMQSKERAELTTDISKDESF